MTKSKHYIQKDFIGKLPGPIWIVAGLSIAPLVLFLPSLINNELLYGWDSSGEFDFWRTWAYSYINQGIIPFYNEHILGGYPLLLDPQQAPFYPPNILHGIFPFYIALSLLVIGHCYWAGLGIYFAARSIKARRLHALLAAICWQCATPYIGQILLGTIPQFMTLSWVGFCIYFTEKICTNNSIKYISLWVLSFGAAFLAGHTQFATYILYASLLYLTLRILSEPELRSKTILLKILAGLVLLTLLISVQIVLALHLKELSIRSNGLSQGKDNSSLVVFNLISLLMPTLFGEEGHRYYWGLGFQNMWMPFIGIWWVWLWISNAKKSFNHSTTLACVVVMVVTLTLSIGFPHPTAISAFAHIPGLDLFRAPIRWTAIACVFALVGGAALWTKIEENEGIPRLKKLMLGLPIFTILIGFIILFIPDLSIKVFNLWHGKLLFPSLANIYPNLPDPLLNQIPWDHITSGAICLFFMMAYQLINTSKSRYNHFFFALFIITPSLVLAKRQIITVPPETFHYSNNLKEFLKNNNPGHRIATFTPAVAAPMPKWIGINYFWNNKYSQWDQHAGMIHGISNAGGYVSLPPKNYLELAVGIDKETLKPLEMDWNFYKNGWILDILGVGFVLQKAVPTELTSQPDWCDPSLYQDLNQKIGLAGKTQDNYAFCENTPGEKMADLTPVTSIDGYDILKNINPFPEAWPVRFIRTIPQNKWLNHTHDLGYGLRQSAVVIDTQDLGLGQDTSPLDETESANKLSTTNPNVFKLNTILKTRRLVVLSLPFDSAWKAYKDGKQLKLHRVNYALTGVVLGRGEQSITFEYQPPLFKLFSILSLLTFILTAIIFIFTKRIDKLHV